MGEAKRRGSFEVRKAEGEKKLADELELRRSIQRRKPSPKRAALMSYLAVATAIGMSGTHTKEIK